MMSVQDKSSFFVPEETEFEPPNHSKKQCFNQAVTSTSPVTPESQIAANQVNVLYFTPEFLTWTS